MAKQLNSETGKGWFLAQGQCAIEAMLNDGTTQAELAERAKLFKNGDVPNAGAVSNIMKSLGWGPFNGYAKPAPTAKPASAPTAKPAVDDVDTLPIPGRVEAFFEYKLGWNMNFSIQPHHIEIVIRCDDVSWNQLALKFGTEEIAMLGAFLESEGYCPVARVSQRGPWLAEQKRIAEQKRLADSIAAITAIDNRLASQRERFENSRFDADITAFYAA